MRSKITCRKQTIIGTRQSQQNGNVRPVCSATLTPHCVSTSGSKALCAPKSYTPRFQNVIAFFFFKNCFRLAFHILKIKASDRGRGDESQREGESSR